MSYILDLILTKKEELFTQVEVGGLLCNNDHCEIEHKMKWHESVRSEIMRPVHDFGEQDIEGLRKYLQVVDSLRTSK